MLVYRLVKLKSRARDLSGIGAFRFGGRWNSKGTYMLYTSETVSLAYLESLVHFDTGETPPHLYLMKIEIDDSAPILILRDGDYPVNWKRAEQPEVKMLGDKWMKERKYLVIGVKSAVNELEHNYLLNPLFPEFSSLVRVIDVQRVPVDSRLK